MSTRLQISETTKKNQDRKHSAVYEGDRNHNEAWFPVKRYIQPLFSVVHEKLFLEQQRYGTPLPPNQHKSTLYHVVATLALSRTQITAHLSFRPFCIISELPSRSQLLRLRSFSRSPPCYPVIVRALYALRIRHFCLYIKTASLNTLDNLSGERWKMKTNPADILIPPPGG